MHNVYINGFPEIEISPILVDESQFLSGEVHVKIRNQIPSNKSTHATIFARANNSNHIMCILLTNDALKRMGYEKIDLFLPYIPFSRQDAVMVEGEPFSIKVFADIINLCNFNSVTVFDPHSGVSPAVIDRCKIISNHVYVNICINDIFGNNWNGERFIVSPDSGSYKKIFKLSDYLKTEKGFNSEVVVCNKARDLSNGKIMAFSVEKDDLQGKECIIIDDICSRGGTFMGIAKELKNKNAGKIYLIVSHYEDVANIANLKESGIERIYTTQSMTSKNDDFIYSIPFNKILVNC